MLSFATKYYPPVPNLKPVLMNDWHLIRQQLLLRGDPPLISYKRTYSCEQNDKKAKTHVWESGRLLTLYLHNRLHHYPQRRGRQADTQGVQRLPLQETESREIKERKPYLVVLYIPVFSWKSLRVLVFSCHQRFQATIQSYVQWQGS